MMRAIIRKLPVGRRLFAISQEDAEQLVKDGKAIRDRTGLYISNESPPPPKPVRNIFIPKETEEETQTYQTRVMVSNTLAHKPKLPKSKKRPDS